jgi:hypothetical protein
MPQAVQIRQRNALLNALSATDFALLEPYLRSVPLHSGIACNQRTGVSEPSESGLGSIVAVGGGGRRQAEVAIVGWEGMTGLPVVLGAERSPCDVFMQIEGSGQSIGADQLSEAIASAWSDASCASLTCLPCKPATPPLPTLKGKSRSAWHVGC